MVNGNIERTCDFTSIELRCIAKYWEIIKSKVVFYEEGYQVDTIPDYLNELIPIYKIPDRDNKKAALQELRTRYLEKLKSDSEKTKPTPFSLGTSTPPRKRSKKDFELEPPVLSSDDDFSDFENGADPFDDPIEKFPLSLRKEDLDPLGSRSALRNFSL